jgi:hypothetical protein
MLLFGCIEPFGLVGVRGLSVLDLVAGVLISFSVSNGIFAGDIGISGDAGDAMVLG